MPDGEKYPRIRDFGTAHTPQPQIAVLGQSPFTTILTNAGGGQTRFGALAVTRWRSDPTLDDSGQWCYVKDLTTNAMWSAGFQPTCVDPLWYRVRFEDDCVSFHRKDGDIETLMEIVVASDEAIEIRRITLGNTSSSAHDIELTTCSEVVIAPFNADRGHPAFSNLFVQTEWVEECRALLAMRRPRSAENSPVWCGHVLCTSDEIARSTSCETDRAMFIGRGQSYRAPRAMSGNGELSGRTGAVLDPVFALRARLSVAAGESVSVSFATFMADDREDALMLAKLCRDQAATAALFAKARSPSNEPAGQLYLQLANELLFPSSLRSGEAVGGKNELANLGISGALPIMVATIGTQSGLPSALELVRVHDYWRSKGIRCDLAIIGSGSFDELTTAVDAANNGQLALHDDRVFDHPGSVFLYQKGSLNAKHFAALGSNARVEIDCDKFDVGTYLAAQKAEQ